MGVAFGVMLSTVLADLHHFHGYSVPLRVFAVLARGLQLVIGPCLAVLFVMSDSKWRVRFGYGCLAIGLLSGLLLLLGAGSGDWWRTIVWVLGTIAGLYGAYLFLLDPDMRVLPSWSRAVREDAPDALQGTGECSASMAKPKTLVGLLKYIFQ